MNVNLILVILGCLCMAIYVYSFHFTSSRYSNLTVVLIYTSFSINLSLLHFLYFNFCMSFIYWFMSEKRWIKFKSNLAVTFKFSSLGNWTTVSVTSKAYEHREKKKAKATKTIKIAKVFLAVSELYVLCSYQ